jgi:DNA-binding transcriptional ArsR family regulator
MVEYSSGSLDQVFHALADSTRRAILLRMAKEDCHVTEVAKPFNMSLAAVSKHLKVLENAKLLTRTKNGRIHRFKLNVAPLAQAHALIGHLEEFWNERLDALEEFLLETEKVKRAGNKKLRKNRRKSS